MRITPTDYIGPDHDDDDEEENMTFRPYIGPSPEEDRTSGAQAKAISLRERMERKQAEAARQERIGERIELAGKVAGGLLALGCLGVLVLTALTGLGLIVKLFSWAWGL